MTTETLFLKYVPQFLPILLIAYFVSDTPGFINASITVLGRLVAVFAILLYTKLNTLYGILVCLLIIAYYDSDEVSSAVGVKYDKEGFETPPKDSDPKDEFRKEHCVNGQLTKKGQVVKKDMIEHVFPEIDNATRCNVCNSNCDFTLLDQRMRSEENLIKPRDSNESDVWTISRLTSFLN